MKIEETISQYGCKQIIRSHPRIIKIDDRYLEVRLIETQKYSKPEEFTHAMPRARFVSPSDERFYYLVSKQDLEKLRKGEKIEKNTNNPRPSK